MTSTILMLQVLFFPAMKPEEQANPNPQKTAHPGAGAVATAVSSPHLSS